jgi:hypothetical protein
MFLKNVDEKINRYYFYLHTFINVIAFIASYALLYKIS